MELCLRYFCLRVLSFQSEGRCRKQVNIYSDLAEVDAVIKRAPRTLLVVRLPRFLESLGHTLALLPLRPVTAGDSRGTRNAVHTRITVAALHSRGTLCTHAVLQSRRGGEEDKQKHTKTNEMK